MADGESQRFLTKSAYAASILRQALEEGRYGAGERLQATKLAKDLGLSLTPVREALIELANEGLVEIAPHRGARVAEIPLTDLSEVYLVRSMLESAATSIAAARIGKAELTRLLKVHDAFKDAVAEKDAARLRSLNDEFHFMIYNAAATPLLRRLIRLVWRSAPRDTFSLIPERAAHSARDHEEIVQSLVARDPRRAEQAMRSHIQDSLDLITRFKQRSEKKRRNK